MTKVLTIGSATMDVFVECDDANIVSVCSKNKNSDFMSYPYGSKIDITTFSSNVGGGGVNTACNFDNLGFDTSAIFKIGKDIYSEGILDSFKPRGVKLDNIIQKEYDVRQSVYDLGQKEYMLFRIYNRDGYVNIIDDECTEEEIKAYQNELRKNYKRYDKMDSYL